MLRHLATVLAHLVGLCAALLLSFSAQARVFEPASLYAVSLPVSNQDPAEQESRLRDALGAVLVRLTGDREIARDPLANPVISRAGNLVQSFGYTSKTITEPDPLDPEGDPVEREQLMFTARFDPGAVNNTVLSARLPVWGSERPITAVWLALRDDQGEQILTDAQASELAAGMLDAARERGLPLLIPSDATVRASGLTPAVLFDGNDDAVLNASEQLGAQAVAVGTLSQVGAGWQGSWTLLQPEAPAEYWDVSGVTLEEPQADGIHRIADNYAARYAQLGISQSSSVAYASIDGLGEPEDYARLVNYLGSLSLVESADLLALNDGTGIFRLMLRGDTVQFEQSIGLSNVLRRSPGGGSDPRLRYYEMR